MASSRRWSWHPSPTLPPGSACTPRDTVLEEAAGRASPTVVALEDMDSKTELSAAGAASAPQRCSAADPPAPQVEKQPGSRARMCQCSERWDLNNLCQKYCLQISACNKWSMCRLKYSHSRDSFFLGWNFSFFSKCQSFIAQELAFSDISLCFFRLHVAVHSQPSVFSFTLLTLLGTDTSK